MTDKELRRLGRKELLEMLIEQGKENERLRAELEEEKAKEKFNTDKIEKAGSLAEAWVSVSGAIEAADIAAAKYLADIKRLYEEAQKEHDRIIAEAVEISKNIIIAPDKDASVPPAKKTGARRGRPPKKKPEAEKPAEKILIELPEDEE